MDAKVLFWGGALVNLTVIVALVVWGVVLARRGRVLEHRRSMLTAVALVFGFLAAYVVKVIWFGREDLSSWSPGHRSVLRFHEVCVGVMLLTGGVAGARAFSMRGTRRLTARGSDPETPDRLLRSHRLAGRFALGGAVLGLLSAFGVLAGMIGRL